MANFWMEKAYKEQTDTGTESTTQPMDRLVQLQYVDNSNGRETIA